MAHLAPRGARLQSWSMRLADLKNDFVSRRIFANHPDILRGLLTATSADEVMTES
ncbi:hypothetical protein WME76_28680 [Sorangium sp. So ce119]|uniref:hypothetical protein n=1 Tax=Sorangium sp. So ce119 TaxID=3133279 RepID=UPI003F60387E